MTINMQSLMKKAEEVKRNIEDIKKRLGESVFEGIAGAGLVKVGMSGEKVTRWVDIDESLIQDRETLQDLLVVAFNNARSNVDTATREEMKKAGLPDFDAPF